MFGMYGHQSHELNLRILMVTLKYCCLIVTFHDVYFILLFIYFVEVCVLSCHMLSWLPVIT